MNYSRFNLAIIALIYPFISLPGIAQIKPKINPSQQLNSSFDSKLPVDRQPTSFVNLGTEILLNGKTIVAPWATWQVGSTLVAGISDTVLERQFGVELAQGDSNKQLVNWDGMQQAASMPIGVKLSQQYRYLDIAAFRRNGWQWQVVGGKLQLNTPATRVLEIQREIIPKNGKINVKLDRYTPWKLSQTPTEGYLTIEATAAPALLAQLNVPSAISDNNLDPDDDPTEKKLEYKVTSNNNQTIVQFPIVKGQRARARLLSRNYLQVSINPSLEMIPTRNIDWAPGIKWNQKWVTLGTSNFPVSYLEIDPRQKGLTMRPMLAIEPNSIGTNHLIKFVPTTQAAAAINGGYFNRNTRMPLGALKRDGKWLSSPILNRGAIGWNDRGQFRIARLQMTETIDTSKGERLGILTLNSGYVQAGLGRYTSEWGTTYSPIQANELIIIVQQDKVTQIVPGNAAGSINVSIPRNGYLLALRGQPERSASLPIGISLTLQQQITPAELAAYPQIVAAGPWLVEKGRIVLDAKGENFSAAFGKETAARSAIASTALGNIILIAVHDRAGGRGPTLAEMAQLLQQLGAVDALNLDGGSSTSLYLGGQLVNRASATAARVHNGIGIFLAP
jgi:Phosphodiester glycosidase